MKRSSTQTDRKNERIVWIAALVLCSAWAAFRAFSIIGSDFIYDWDEARHGINAFEMLQNGNYIVNTMLGEIDYWNAKPPLSMWQIVLSYKLFGYNLVGLRFFSSLYLPFITLVGMVFLYRKVGIAASSTTGLLFASAGMRFYHLFHTGDADALFFFLSFLVCLSLYLAIQNRSRWLIVTGLLTSMAFLTKSMHVVSLLVLIAVILLYEIFRRKTLGLMETLLWFLPAFFQPIAAWAIARYQYDGTQFFTAMIVSDLLNRVATTVESHSGGPLFYVTVIRSILGNAFFWGILLLIVAWLLLDLTTPISRRTANDGVFIRIFSTMFLAPMLIFSFASTKLGWYIYPSIIGLFFLAGYAVQRLWNRFVKPKTAMGYRAVVIACCIPLLVGVEVVTVQGNLDAIASTSSESSVITRGASLTTFCNYITVDSRGNDADIPNSWTLQAMFDGYTCHLGGMDTYDSLQDAVVVLSVNAPQDLLEFSNKFPQLELVCETAGFALYQ